MQPLEFSGQSEILSKLYMAVVGPILVTLPSFKIFNLT